MPNHDNDMVTDHAETPPLRLNPEDYEQQLAAFDLTETEKEDLLEALFQIIVNFVDLGFGIHPIQQACGQVQQSDDGRTIADQKPLYWSHAILEQQTREDDAPLTTDSNKGDAP